MNYEQQCKCGVHCQEEPCYDCLKRDNWESAMKVKILEEQNYILKRDNEAYKEFVAEVMLQRRGEVKPGGD